MDFNNGEQYSIAEPEEIATIENVTQMCAALLTRYGFNGSGWQDLRECLYKFCLDEIEHGKPPGSYTLGEMGSEVRAFYHGYMSCQDYWKRELEKFTLEIKEKYHIQEI